MDYAHYRSEIAQLIARRNGYVLLALASLALCIALVGLVFCLLGREKIVLVPSTVEKSFWVARNASSPEYLSEMSTFFAVLRLNTTVASAPAQHQTLLRYTDPRAYGALKSQLAQEASRLQEQHLAFAFFPIDTQVDSAHLTAFVIGDLQSTVGENILATQRVQYQLRYRWAAGRLWLCSFEEVKHA